MSKTFLRSAAALSVATFGAAAVAGVNSHVTFDNGPEGWSINGWDTPDAAGGNPGANLHWANFVDTFGLSLRNDTNADFIGDYTTRGPVRLSVDVNVTSITFFGQQVSRDLVLELRDYDNPPANYPYVSVWLNAGALPDAGSGWQTMHFDILDPTSATLPAGWGGTGAEDPNTFEPILPPDRTYASVLAGVDEIQFTTFVPGFFYGFTNFDVAFDNIRITAVPTPGVAGAMIFGLAGAGLRRRR